MVGKRTALSQKGTPSNPKHCLLKGKSVDTALTEAHMKLATATLKLKKYKDRAKRLRSSKLFQKSHKHFCDSLRSNSKIVTDPPAEEDVTAFWTCLFSHTTTHNNEAAWFQVEEESVQHVKEQQWTDITPNELHRTIFKTKNWKAPGVDLVHNYWYKHLLALQQWLCDALNGVILDPMLLPDWATVGTTTLPLKKGPDCDPNKNRPITCLSTLYKLVTLLFTDRVYDHLIWGEILLPEQKGIKHCAHRCKDHLLLDKLILRYTHRNKHNLGIAWTNYQKAYDSIPHSWIICALK
eukprot:10987596-Ditylum_brightwellii.AAC.1